MAKRANGVSLSGEAMPKGKRIRGPRTDASDGQGKAAPSGGEARASMPERAGGVLPAVAKSRNGSPRIGASNGLGRHAPSDARVKVRVPLAGDALPSVAKIGSQSLLARKGQRVFALGGEDATAVVPATANRAVPLAAIIAEIVELQVKRRFCIKSQSRCDRSCEAFIARYLGFHTDLDEKARKKLFDQAAEIRKAVEKGDGESQAWSAESQYHRALTVARPIVLLSAQSRKAWDDYRLATEARMRELARLTPGWGFAQSIKGFSDLGLAVIIGEAGMGSEEKPGLANYATVERLWKRMGLAVFDGKRQGNPGKNAPAEEWTRHGYRPSRRAEMWAFFSDVMFRHQWRAEKDGQPAHAIGPYGEVYARRRAQTADREGWSKGRQHNDARRIMTKALLEDLLKVWKAAVEPVADKAEMRMPPDKARRDKGQLQGSPLSDVAALPEPRRAAA